MTKADEKKVRAMARRFAEDRDELWDKLVAELQGQTKADCDEVEELFAELTRMVKPKKQVDGRESEA